MDIVGPHVVLPIDEPGADLSRAEYVYRWSPLTGIYGGTLEVFRNMIAQYILGLGKPVYAAPRPPRRRNRALRDMVEVPCAMCARNSTL